MRQAEINDVTAMLSKAMGSGLAGMPLPPSNVHFRPVDLACINTVYDDARNRSKPSKARLSL